MGTKQNQTVKKIFLCLLTAIFLFANLYFILYILQNVSGIVSSIISSSDILNSYITTDAEIAPFLLFPISEAFAAVLTAIFYRKNMPLYYRIAAYAAVPVQLIAVKGQWAVQDFIDPTLSDSTLFCWDTPGYKAYSAICAIIYTAVSVLIIIGTVKGIINLSKKPIDNPANA